MRLALFGGTFDPIHWGHLLVASAAQDAFHLDRILFVPSGIPPHKRLAIARAPQRLAMVRAAIRSNSAFAASDWEIRQKRTVYTWETLAHFRESIARKNLFFIVGTDMLATVDQWVTGRSLLQQCQFLAMERPGWPWIAFPQGSVASRGSFPAPRSRWPATTFARAFTAENRFATRSRSLWSAISGRIGSIDEAFAWV